MLVTVNEPEQFTEILRISKKLSDHSNVMTYVTIKKDMPLLERDDFKNLLALNDQRRADSQKQGEEAN